MKQIHSLSILIPVYKGSNYLGDALESVFRQNFSFLELIVVDDNKPEDKKEIERTKKIVSSYKDSRVRYVKNAKNLGSQGSIKKLASLAHGDILFYLCQDDLLSSDSLKTTYDIFKKNKDVGAVVRPYFWFEKDIKNPVRVVYPPNKVRDVFFTKFDGETGVTAIFGSVGQLSGLAFRKKIIDTPFNLDVFPGHIYPIAGILKNHTIAYLHNFTVAVRIESSQARNISSTYDISPLASWIKMFTSVYKQDQYKDLRKWGIKHIVTNYVGLVQIKNFGTMRAVIQEIINTIKFYPQSLLDVKFWFYSLLALLTPRRLLVQLSDNYKRHILAKQISDIYFNY